MRWPLAVPEEQTGGRKSKGSEARKDSADLRNRKKACVGLEGNIGGEGLDVGRNQMMKGSVFKKR